MMELIWTDIRAMGRPLKAYALFLCLCLLLSIPGIFPLPMVTAMTSVIFIMLPVGAVFQGDMETPLCRRSVTARYLFVLLMALMAASVGLSAGVFMSIAGLRNAADALITVLVSLSTGLLIASVLLPLRYRLGQQRARPWLYPVVVLPLAALLREDSPLEKLSLAAAGYLGICALLGFGLSWFISSQIGEEIETG